MKKLDLDLLTFEEFKAVLEKSKNQSYSSGCLMGYFNKGFKDPKIKEDDLYNNEENEYGLEIEPHVTVLYGLHDDEIDENEIIKLFTLIDGPVVTTNKITLFKNEKFDVVLLSTHRSKAIAATYFFLSKLNCRVRKVMFVDSDEEKW
jgi:hypothetical protein